MKVTFADSVANSKTLVKPNPNKEVVESKKGLNCDFIDKILGNIPKCDSITDFQAAKVIPGLYLFESPSNKSLYLHSSLKKTDNLQHCLDSLPLKTLEALKSVSRIVFHNPIKPINLQPDQNQPKRIQNEPLKTNRQDLHYPIPIKGPIKPLAISDKSAFGNNYSKTKEEIANEKLKKLLDELKISNAYPNSTNEIKSSNNYIKKPSEQVNVKNNYIGMPKIEQPNLANYYYTKPVEQEKLTNSLIKKTNEKINTSNISNKKPIEQYKLTDDFIKKAAERINSCSKQKPLEQGPIITTKPVEKMILTNNTLKKPLEQGLPKNNTLASDPIKILNFETNMLKCKSRAEIKKFKEINHSPLETCTQKTLHSTLNSFQNGYIEQREMLSKKIEDLKKTQKKMDLVQSINSYAKQNIKPVKTEETKPALGHSQSIRVPNTYNFINKATTHKTSETFNPKFNNMHQNALSIASVQNKNDLSKLTNENAQSYFIREKLKSLASKTTQIANPATITSSTPLNTFENAQFLKTLERRTQIKLTNNKENSNFSAFKQVGPIKQNIQAKPTDNSLYKDPRIFNSNNSNNKNNSYPTNISAVKPILKKDLPNQIKSIHFNNQAYDTNKSMSTHSTLSTQSTISTISKQSIDNSYGIIDKLIFEINTLKQTSKNNANIVNNYNNESVKRNYDYNTYSKNQNFPRNFKI